jgi:uracil-DNA glycosylase
VTTASFLEALVGADFGAACNFYRDGEGAATRRERLRGYLLARRGAPLLLVGEAPGYRGTRVSGIPFTSERQISGSGPSESTATIVHRVLGELGIADWTLLWNALPAHPHLPGQPESNRRPRRDEVALGLPFVEALAAGRHVVAVGRVAGEALSIPWIRHPSHGGGSAFREALRAELRLLHSGIGGSEVRRFSVL